MNIYDKPLLVIRNGEIRTEGYWKITVPGTVVLVSGQRFMFLSSDNTRDGFWRVLRAVKAGPMRTSMPYAQKHCRLTTTTSSRRSWSTQNDRSYMDPHMHVLPVR